MGSGEDWWRGNRGCEVEGLCMNSGDDGGGGGRSKFQQRVRFGGEGGKFLGGAALRGEKHEFWEFWDLCVGIGLPWLGVRRMGIGRIYCFEKFIAHIASESAAQNRIIVKHHIINAFPT